MQIYITFFDVGEGSEVLAIDYFHDDITDEVIRWGSREEYFAARMLEHEPIDGGAFSHGLAAGIAQIPDRFGKGRIISVRPPDGAVEILRTLDGVVRTMRTIEWPEWPDE